LRHTADVSKEQAPGTEVNAPIARDVRARVRLLAVRTAEHLARTQQLDAAADILEKYLAVHGPEAEIMRLLGGMRLKQGRAREAALLLERALARHFECTHRTAAQVDEPNDRQAAFSFDEPAGEESEGVAAGQGG
jgi:hypothetical protein